jgi:pimeloyl-ACP methyl ester carboxylesterase
MPHVRVDDIQLYYEERGRGPALLFIAGLGGRPGQFAGLVDAFADRYRCITFDNRGGAGQTDKPPGPYSIARFAADTAGLLDALGIDRAHVAGFSMGGMIAQELALRYPERCRSLILEGTAAGVDAYVERFIRLRVSARMHLPAEDFQWFLSQPARCLA